MELRKLLIRLNNKEKPLLKVYSHPRSGTHFLEAFLAKNFYSNINLHIDKVTWGHWSNRKPNEKGNPYGKLFGNHFTSDLVKHKNPKIYIIRDGRSVAYSVWKTENFLHKDLQGIAFKDFLRTPIDWQGSPAVKTEPRYTITQHWQKHISSWLDQEKKDKTILIVFYEDLVNTPYQVYLKIHHKFFSNQKKLTEAQVDPIKKPVGLLPNKATKDSWKEVFDEEDLDYFYSKLPINFSYNKL